MHMIRVGSLNKSMVLDLARLLLEFTVRFTSMGKT